MTPPGLSLASDSVCDVHGKDLEAQLLLANDVVLLASLSRNLQQLLGWFAVECEAVGMRVLEVRGHGSLLENGGLPSLIGR